MQCFFHLVNAHEAITDHVGVDIKDSADAHTIAMRISDVLRREHPSFLGEATGWQLKVVGSSGRVLFILDLDPTTTS
jgi:hypothetical protein